MTRARARFLLGLVVLLFAWWAVERPASATEHEPDRSTPRRAMTAFLVAAEARDYDAAARSLDLAAIAPGERARLGAELASQLHHVLERNLSLEADTLSDDPAGDPADGVDVEQIGAVRSEGAKVPIVLSRGSGSDWLVSSSTVARIPRLYDEYAPGFIESRVPSALNARAWGLAAWQWLGVLVGMVAAFVIARAVVFLATRIAKRFTKRTELEWDDDLIDALRRPGRFLVGIVAFTELLSLLGLTAAATHVFTRLLGMILIGTLAWAAGGLVGVVSGVLERRAMVNADGPGDADLRARGVKTQVRVLRRVINVGIGILAVALMLTQFEVVRTIGMSLLASAGVAGVVLGFAAQRTIGSLIAGIQLSFTQPIRIGDVVIVEGEWGRIEEVTLTFVVIRVWDERRLIVPMTRFLEQPFQNWTKVSPELHGTVYLQVDYTLPMGEMRKELDRIVTNHPKWDGRTKSLSVTNATERTMEVRAVVSAGNSGDLWDLRVAVREELIAWLRDREGGKFLPRVRVDDEELPSRAAMV